MSDKCDNCINYIYNDEYEIYECLVNLDEDEMYNFMKGSFDNCPYFKQYDEYGLVRKQN